MANRRPHPILDSRVYIGGALATLVAYVLQLVGF